MPADPWNKISLKTNATVLPAGIIEMPPVVTPLAAVVLAPIDWRGIISPVNFPAMSNPVNSDNLFTVVDGIKNPVITNPDTVTIFCTS